jgi:hypothetical protein
MEFTGVQLAGGAELTAPVEKAAAGPVEKAAAGCSGREGHDGGGGRRRNGEAAAHDWERAAAQCILQVGMKAVWTFFNHIRDKIHLERFKSIRI